MDELLSEFVAETQESLDALANVVLALEADPTDRSLLDQLFRFFHTVKGSCSFLNLPRFERLSHAAEDVLSTIRSGGLTLDAVTISAVLSVMDRIGELCLAIDSGDSLPDHNDEQLIEALLHCRRIAQVRGKGVSDNGHETAADSDADRDDAAASPAEWPMRGVSSSRTVRLPLILIDQLMNGVSDMVLSRNELARTLRAKGCDPETDAAFERLSGCIAEMRDTISKTRMQRIDRLFMAIPRVVRDLSRELGKIVTLQVDGGDVEMDREMVEMIIDPLTHIVRNSVDHGIERPEERLAAGKGEAGLLRLSAHQSGSQIVIEVADDGRGIDVHALTEKAVLSGLISEQDALHMTEQEKLHLICAPGLTTADKVTAVSGRGVGMDIVRANIERIGGTLSLASQVGRGLTITMRVPLTLTIIPGLILNAGGMSFAIPRAVVMEIVHDNSPTVSINEMSGAMMATIRGVRYSMIPLETVVGLPVTEQQGPRSLIIVRSTSGLPYVLSVCQVDNHEDLVIRPAAPAIMAAGIYGGMTLPDNGRPLLLLDAGGIAQVANLVLTAEPAHAPAAEDPHQAGGRLAQDYTALRFTELSGEDRVIRLSLVERVEDVPVGQFGYAAGQSRVQIDGRLLPCFRPVRAADMSAETRVITCLRLCDGEKELMYPVASVSDVVQIPEEMDASASHDIVAGVVLVDGCQTEVVDGFALLAAMADRNEKGDAAPVRCVIADREDVWNREILAPLLAQAGYDVVLGYCPATLAEEDVLFLTGQDGQAPEPAGNPVIRLRSGRVPADELDDSIYRYDRETLFAALRSFADEGKAA